MKKISKITIIGLSLAGFFSFANAADLTALTDATVKLIKNQTAIQQNLRQIYGKLNVLDAKIQKNTILVKNATDLAIEAKKLANNFQKKIDQNRDLINNIQEKNKIQDENLEKIQKSILKIEKQLTKLNSTMQINQKLTQAHIKAIQKDLLARLSDVKTSLENQIDILKQEFQTSINNLKNNLNAQITKNKNAIQMNQINLNALKAQHNTDINLLKKQFNNKIESLRKVLQGEIDIITAKIQGLGPIVVVNDNKETTKTNVPVKCQNENCNKKAENADKIINNFLKSHN